MGENSERGANKPASTNQTWFACNIAELSQLTSAGQQSNGQSSNFIVRTFLFQIDRLLRRGSSEMSIESDIG